MKHGGADMKVGGYSAVDIAVPVALVYANNHWSKGTMLTAPKKFIKNAVSGISRTLGKASGSSDKNRTRRYKKFASKRK